MGQYLSAPVTEKVSGEEYGEQIAYGFASMQGWRITMEDAHIALLSLSESPPKTSFFAVFDGHGGSSISRFAERHMARILKSTPEFKAGKLREAITAAYYELDAMVASEAYADELKELGRNPDDRPQLETMSPGGTTRPTPPPAPALFGGISLDAAPTGQAAAGGAGPGGAATPPGRRALIKAGSSNDFVKSHLMRVSVLGSHDDHLREHLRIHEENEEGEGTPRPPAELVGLRLTLPEDGPDVGDGGSDADATPAPSGLAGGMLFPEAGTGLAAPSGGEGAARPSTASSTASTEPSAQSGPGNLLGGGFLFPEANTKIAGAGDGPAAASPSPPPAPPSPPEVSKPPTVAFSSGCTAVSMLVRDGKVLVANSGDSRAVLSRKGQAVALSTDHKPILFEEARRIINAGGFVRDNRVNGSLNLSRAIGDHDYKSDAKRVREAQMVVATPDVEEFVLSPGDEFAIIACDGVWDVLTNQEAVDFVRSRIRRGTGLREAAEALCDECLAPDLKGLCRGADNMSVIIILFKKTAKFGSVFGRMLGGWGS